MTSGYQRILLIEDDNDDQVIFAEVLQDFGPLVLNIASNGLEAIKTIMTQSVPDIIFLDLNMPVMNGKEFIKAIKEKNIYHGPIVILSTSSSEDDILACQTLGITNFLTKPGSFSELTKMISLILIGDTEFQA